MPSVLPLHCSSQTPMLSPSLTSILYCPCVFYSILNLNNEWYSLFSHMSLSTLASTYHHPTDVFLAKFTNDQHMAKFNNFQTSFCLTSKQFSAQLLLPFFLWHCLPWIVFHLIPWHWALMILFPHFCLHLSFLCWLLCLLTSTCWSPSDLNLGSSFLFTLPCVIKAISHTCLVLQTMCKPRYYIFSFNSLLTSKFVLPVFKWYVCLDTEAQLYFRGKIPLISTSITNDMSFSAQNCCVMKESYCR